MIWLPTNGTAQCRAGRAAKSPCTLSTGRPVFPPSSQLLNAGGRRFVDFLPELRVRQVEQEEIERFDAESSSFGT
jgi:hypothetical protein